ncbi:hypothetical protein [Lactobacillus brevis] [Lactiplantibacillus mudanjiangensis]|uniref:hypothetical protein n=1 Tax=Lactiplantibacillus mudanjiangensis TaxID=1296538 RepID=UPI0010156A65|nr:hypothetical protein [Lactiplantibacillus mudanjiangensis]VDG32892.1 hypothetical protein [Lactobacillus brevis] [Lactiplantibacillus mudanjiangensis]
MSLDFLTGSDGDLTLDPDTGDFQMIEDEGQTTQAVRIALGTNIGELDWNEDFGFGHLNLFSLLDDEGALQAELENYLTDVMEDQIIGVTVDSVDKLGRTATIHLTIEINTDESIQTDLEVSDSGTD